MFKEKSCQKVFLSGQMGRLFGSIKKMCCQLDVAKSVFFLYLTIDWMDHSATGLL